MIKSVLTNWISIEEEFYTKFEVNSSPLLDRFVVTFCQLLLLYPIKLIDNEPENSKPKIYLRIEHNAGISKFSSRVYAKSNNFMKLVK